MINILQYVLYLTILIILAVPLGTYIKKVMNNETTLFSKILMPLEEFIYKIIRIDKDEQMSWKKYSISIIMFSGIGLIFLFLLQLMQGVLPGNPENFPGIPWDLSLNTAISFVTNTNWQAYSGESTMSYLVQALGLTTENFVSAATGIAVLFALIRGFIKVQSDGLGSFWVDITRIIIHILLPINLVIALLLVGGGVIQNLDGAKTVSLLEPIAISDGQILEGAEIDLENNIVTLDGNTIEDAEIITEQFVPMGPAASQIAIKQTGTNGGGYTGVNSAHPLENPNGFTNLVEMLSILLIPAALCFTFGAGVKNKRQGIAIFMAMFAAMVPGVMDSLANSGPHGFSEMLYAYSSAGGNNGSAFAGFSGNTIFLNLSLGLAMLLGRFLPIIGTLAIAGSLARKKKLAITAGTLSTTNPLFVFMLILIVLLIGALSFFPSLALGPIAEFFSNIV